MRSPTGCYYFFVAVVALLDTISATSASNNNTPKQPNILLLFPDEWRFDWDGMHDDPTGPIPLNVPFLKEFAANGTQFLQAYVPAPVCAPSRSCLASGREYDEAHVMDNFGNDYPINQTTFYTLLRDKGGYHVMSAGKDDLTKATQLGYRVGQTAAAADGTYHLKELGFSDALRHSGKDDVIDTFPNPHEMYGFYLRNQTVALQNGTFVTGWDSHHACMKSENGLCDATSYPDQLYEDNWVGRNAIELLNRKPADKPWFLQVNFPGPHPPFLVTANMADSVASRTWPAATDPKGKQVICPQVTNNLPHEPANGGRCNYGAEIENLDVLFRNILDEVHALGDVYDTIVCISSDHGEMLGDHGEEGKTKPWQGSASVPLLCSGPGIAKGQKYTFPVATLDLAGTFLDYAGIGLATNMTTKSLRPLLEGKTSDAPRPFVSSGLKGWRMAVKVINGTSFKLVCCKDQCPQAPGKVPKPVKGWTVLLYDTQADPFDMSPLQAQMRDVVTDMLPLLPSGWCPSEEKHKFLNN